MSDIITRNPGYLYWLLEQSTWDAEDGVDALTDALQREVANFQTLDEKVHAVRRFHRRQLLKIGVKDLLGQTAVEATAGALSDLADAIVQVVLRVLWPGHISREGFAVIAMGKLGGHELNYSSDIDLIYVCGDVDDATFASFTKLSRQLTKALSEVTKEGYLYRVDLRLRPDGSVGPVVNTLTALRVYYEHRGRPWEFQAMLKARVIAGDTDTGEQMLGHVSGLAFNPLLSYSPVETVSLMRAQIRQNIGEKERALNIKLMEGGIRDIEFIVQMLQLMYGGKQPTLRTPNTLAGLEALRQAGLLKQIEAETLRGAYSFFRLVEHRLQMMHQLKTHSIPESHEEIEQLAGRLSRGPAGSFTRKDLLDKLTSSLTQVRLLSDSFFAGRELPEAATLLLLPSGDERAIRALAAHGIRDTKRAQSIIHTLAYGAFPDLVDRNARASFQQLLPKLLPALAQTGDADRALINFSELAKASRSVSPFYEFLAGSVGARELILKLVGSSTLLTNRLSVHMDALDPLFEDPHALLDAAGSSAPWSVLTSTGQDTQLLQREVARAVDLSMLAGWFIDAGAGTFPRALSGAVGTTTKRLVTDAMATLLDMQDVAVLALGSLAVGEPRIGSDVDVLVVTRGQEPESITRRLHTLNQTLSQAPGLKIDYRLRGEGANAPLVQDLSFYEKYFATRMGVWERISFAKCAFWHGDGGLADEFIDLLRPLLVKPLTARDLTAITDTRHKLERLVAADATAFETKRSAGGRYDIEYLTWMGVVLSGKPFDLGMPTADRISHIADAGVIGSRTATCLITGLELFAAVDYAMDLQTTPLPKTREKRAELAAYLDKALPVLGVVLTGDIATMLASTKRDVRACYDSVVEQLAGR